ncbi:hypothetical protein, partial [Clostridium tagluense]|uniref:hypothetical protein n=1 Tax=Clostridium tagluense TaxID=360422 RepID=UPI001CF2A6F3
NGEALTSGADGNTGYIKLGLLEAVSQEELDNLIKLEKLIKLKEQRRDLWVRHGWSCQYFTDADNAEDKRLMDEILKIESENIYCECIECGEKDETVDFNSESQDELICEDCWDGIREHIKDKCGLI